MNKYLISLDKDIQRRELFFAQPDTADFAVFSAINTMQKEWEELAEVFYTCLLYTSCLAIARSRLFGQLANIFN